jgi:RNA polymerase sigma-70 factor (ECF subfamily)
MEPADRAARLAALFDTHADRLYRLARRLTASADDALDLVQDTFLRAARALDAVPHGFPDEEAWLTRVLVNIRRDEWRKAAVRRAYAIEQQRRDPPVDAPEHAYVASADVWLALDRLSPRRRAVLVLHELEGLSTSAIATLLGIRVVTVRWHLSRARRDVERHLNARAGGNDAHLAKSVGVWRSASPRARAR